jgi:hypothetical protein
MTIHLVEDLSIGDPHQRSIVPRGEGHEMVERLMTRRDVLRIYPGGQGFDALPLPRKAEADQVGSQGFVAVLVTDGGGETLEILVKATLFHGQGRGHGPWQGT